jgi:hypothetical protein
MAKTITGSIIGTVTLVAGDDPVLVESSGRVYGAPVGIYGGSGVPWTITNHGTITGTAPISTEIAAGIALMSGGSVDNSGTISGYGYGIYIAGDLGIVSNSGLISGADAATNSVGVALNAGGTVTNATTTAIIAGVYTGVGIYNVTGTVINAGTISAGGTDGFAITLDQGGSVDNQAIGGVQAVISGYQNGLVIVGDSGTVTNAGTIIGSMGSGILLGLGGNVVNGVSSASDAGIYGKAYGVFVVDGDATITNYGTITSGLCGCGTNDGVLIASGGTVTNAAGALIEGWNAGVQVGFSAANVYNAGTIGALYGVGVALATGGTITNAAGGTIYGPAFGINVGFGAATVLNEGSIGSGVCGCSTYDGIFLGAGGAVTNTASATIIGYANGVYIYTAAGTVTNSGRIAGQYDAGVRLSYGGGVTNGGSASSIYGQSYGIYIGGDVGTVSNGGTIASGQTTGAFDGIYLRSGGSVTNATSGSITGYDKGITIKGAEGTVVNHGMIVGSNVAGVAFYLGGTLTNAAGATISGYDGVEMTAAGGAGSTLVNAGTITATGALQIAVTFAAPNDLLEIVPGAVFNGQVLGGGTDSTIELASAASTGALSGLGSNFQGFDAIEVDAGARWTLGGLNSVDPGTPITIDAGASLGVIGTLTGGAAYSLIEASLHIAGAVSSGDTFAFGDIGLVSPDTLTLDAVAGTSFDNTVTGFSFLDTIALPSVSFVAGSTPVLGVNTLTVDLLAGGTFTFEDFATAGGASPHFIVTDHAVQEAVCFARGTRIRTETGEMAVENLRPGDYVITLRGDVQEPQPIVWIGRRRIDLSRHPDPDAVRPVRIRRDAFAPGRPHRDLLVSPEHCIAADGMLIPARRLLNGTSIVQKADAGLVEYFHVELERHALLIAEGLPAESYLDTGNRGFFANATGPVSLFADPAPDPSRWQTEACLPLPEDDAAVEMVWLRLATRGAGLQDAGPAVATTREPDLRVLAGDRVLSPVSASGGRHVFTLPPGATTVRLLSRTAAPTLTRPWLNDNRRLGVAVSRIMLCSATERIVLPPDHPGLADGWWDAEGDGTALWRWTAGDACIPLPPGTAVTMLEVQIHAMAAMAYRLAA